MGKHPQLQVAEAEAPDFTAARFFEEVLPKVLAARRSEARQLGGRIGFIIGGRQWIVDLDHGRVRGDRHGSAVTDDDGLDLVLRGTDAAFSAMLRGKAGDELEVLAGERDAVAPLLVVLGGG